MNYLIICTFFPPDSAISAVRPYMLAKYLVKAGNHVTVIRSGAFNAIPDENMDDDAGIEVFSFLGENCEAERFKRGEWTRATENKPRINRIKGRTRAFLAAIYRFFREPFNVASRIKHAKACFEKQRELLDTLKDRHYDVVFSTYSELENIYAGEYAAKLFHAKWIMDFRDPVVQHRGYRTAIWNLFTSKTQKHALKTADLCTSVSEGLTEELRHYCPGAQVETLYNGYEELLQRLENKQESDVLRICYTGQIYSYRQEALEAYANGLSRLVQKRLIDSRKMRFTFAGPASDTVCDLFQKLGLSECLENHGRISRSEAVELQNSSDVFLVLSWNTKRSKGVLTGKFYEGIRAEKPILSIVAGDTPDSELKLLNAKFQYGFCYEICSYEPKQLEDYLLALYTEKTQQGRIQYEPSAELRKAFRYDYIAGRLQELAKTLVSES